MRGCLEAVLSRTVDLAQKSRLRVTRRILTSTLQQSEDTNEQAFRECGEVELR